MKLLVYTCAFDWTWWLGWVVWGHQWPSILLRTSVKIHDLVATSKHSGECDQGVFLCVCPATTRIVGIIWSPQWASYPAISLRTSLRNMMFLIYQAHSGKHHNSIFRCGRPSKTHVFSKRFYLRTCSFLALPSVGLSFLTWHAPQIRVIFLTLLFIKLLISSFGAPGVRFLQLATPWAYHFDDLRGWKILISYCFLQWFLAIHCVPHTGPKSNLHCNFQHLYWSSTSISGPPKYLKLYFAVIYSTLDIMLPPVGLKKIL